MSRKPWTPATRARHAKCVPLEMAERGPHGNSSIPTEPWIDTRKQAKAKAKAELDALRSSVLWRVASQNRKDAKARHAPRYIGHPCDRHENSERYTSSGHCVFCELEYHDKARGAVSAKTRVDRKLRVTAKRIAPVGRFNKTMFKTDQPLKSQFDLLELDAD
jgi:hypothetical protein